jgi:hypothetical protein
LPYQIILIRETANKLIISGYFLIMPIIPYPGLQRLTSNRNRLSRLFFKYYTDVTRYNLAFCIVLCLFPSANLFEITITFGTAGVLISFWIYKYFQNIEYYFYINKGLTRAHLQVKTFAINFTFSILLLFMLWLIKYK